MSPLLLIAGIIETSTAIPYIRDIRRKTTRPAIVSWFTWMLLSGVAAGASFSQGAMASAVLASALALECLAIVAFSIGKGHITYSRFDAFCQLGAFLGLILWYSTKDPIVAVIIFVVVDAIGALPTFRHAWRRPYEETMYTFSLSILANALALVAISDYTFEDTVVPAYLLLLNLLITAELLLRERGPKFLRVKMRRRKHG